MNWYPKTMGILGFSVEEKIGNWMFNHYSPLGVEPFASSSKADATRQAKILLAMYQEGIIDDSIPVFDWNDANKEEQVREYLAERSGLSWTVVVAFTRALWELVQNGEIDLKHMDPNEAETVAETTNAARATKKIISEWTPKSVSSIFAADIPALIERNLLFITLTTLGIGAIVLMPKLKGAYNGRTT